MKQRIENLLRHAGESPAERQIGRKQAVWAADELKRFDAIRESAAAWVQRFTDPA